MGCHLERVGSHEVLICPVLLVVKKGITAIIRKEGVRHGPALTIKGISDVMGMFIKPDTFSYIAKQFLVFKILTKIVCPQTSPYFNVNTATGLPLEGELTDIRPDLEGLLDNVVYLRLLEWA